MGMTIPIVACDKCHKRDVDPLTESTIIRVKLPGQPEVTFSGENCPDCEHDLAVTLLMQLGEFLNREETPVKRQRASRAPRDPSGDPPGPDGDDYTTCPVSDCRRTHPTRGALGQHLRKQHDMNFTTAGIAKIGRR